MNYSDVLSRNFSHDFVKRMQESMVMSAPKYGDIRDKNGTIAKHIEEEEMLDGIRERLRLYRDTGRTEFLVDIANFAMIEYIKMGDAFVAKDDRASKKAIGG